MKRLFDVVVSLCLLILFAPALLLISVLVYLDIGRPIIFRQARPGVNGVPFHMYKFRTMNDEVGSSGELLEDGQRLTRLGGLLRKASLDELPELWNVLKGEMSMVGPRPLLIEYLPLYSPEQARRHEVRPGITGWAQVNGRNALSWEDKFRLDVWYVDNHSFWLDIKILLLTFVAVFRGTGIAQPGHATMEKFRGS